MESQIHQKLFAWWQKEGRVLPWRQRVGEEVTPDVAPHILREKAFQSYFAHQAVRDPYRVVVSELMLQQTQVDRVLPKYQAWMARWPAVQDLAAASLADVLIFWQGLGYNRRARFLWLMAQEVALQRKGIWPQTEVELLELPGIGKYTARAVLSFAFGQQVGVVDTNVKRILQRVYSGVSDAPNALFAFADDILPAKQADPWNQALMDFGALICTAKNPKCAMCPLQENCHANLQAKKQGFANYAAELKLLPAVAKKSQKPFAQTDRYFRGRMMDELRVRQMSCQDLANVMRDSYGLIDAKRFAKLLADLEKEGMLSRSKDLLRIG